MASGVVGFEDAGVGGMETIDFSRFMEVLGRDLGKPEPPIEPCVEHGAKQWEKRKEQAQLEEGAVMKVVRQEGKGGELAQEGDLVKIHYVVSR